MIFKKYTIIIPGKGTVDVSFIIHFQSKEAIVDNINIKTNFNINIIHRPYFVKIGDKWTLSNSKISLTNGKRIFYEDDISKKIINSIVGIKMEEQKSYFNNSFNVGISE